MALAQTAEIARRLGAANPDLAIETVTFDTQGDSDQVSKLLRHGGKGGAFVAEIRRALRDGRLEIDFLGRVVKWGADVVPLSATEVRVLEVMALEPGRVFSRDEILEGMGTGDAAVTERTIDVHVTSIRRKLGEAADRVVTVRGLGYKFEPKGT